MATTPSSPIVRVPLATPTFATPYSAGDVVGTGPITIRDGSATGANPLLDTKTGILKQITVKEDGSQKADLTILLFDQLPTGTYTDNGAFSWGTGDFAKCIGHVAVPGSGFVTVDSKSLSTVEFSRSVQNKEAADASKCLYAVVVTTGTPTYGSATALEILFGFVQD